MWGKIFRKYFTNAYNSQELLSIKYNIYTIIIPSVIMCQTFMTHKLVAIAWWDDLIFMNNHSDRNQLWYNN